MILNEQQQLLKDTIGELALNRAPIGQMRELRDSDDTRGYDDSVWQELTAMGIPMAALPEARDGLGFGWLGMGAVLESLGRQLSATPILSTLVLGSTLIQLAGSHSQREQLQSAINNGNLTLALALDEQHHFNPLSCDTRLRKQGSNYLLHGKKVFVLDGHSADKIIVVARLADSSTVEDGLSLLILDRDEAGISVRRTRLMDGRNAATIEFDSVSVSSEQCLGQPGACWPLLQQALNIGTACIAAEMLGGCQEVFDRTIEHLKEREQFDVKIGSFQALQHRAAKLYCQLESCRSAVLHALATLDQDAGDASLEVSQAKALANECYRDITNEAVQMHGGMGVTDELDIGLFLKRARVSMQILGDTAFHEDRFATLQHY